MMYRIGGGMGCCCAGWHACKIEDRRCGIDGYDIM